VLKDTATSYVRYMGETLVLSGCYLQVRATVKAVAGPLPAVRISGWAGKAGGSAATGLTTVGPSTQLTTYGDVVEITAIIAIADKTGVDMVWDGASYGHLGIDLTGASGGLVRIDDIVVENVTSYFARDMMSVVDVRDYGAKGDGTTDDTAAFEAADAVANGRTILVSEGSF